MDKLFLWLRRPALWILLYLALLSYGLYAWFAIPVEVLPSFHLAQIEIIAHDPGASAVAMETLVTRPLEGQLLGLAGLSNLRSTMGAGTAQLTARFTSGTSPQLALQAVYTAVDRARAELPPGVAIQAKITGNAINEIADYALRVPANIPLWQARHAVAIRIIPALRALSGVQRVEVFGAGKAALWVQPELAKMRAHQITVTAIERALHMQVLLAPAGAIQIGHNDVHIEARSLPLSPAELGDIPVINVQGQAIPLGQIARIVLTGLPVHAAVRLNGKPALGLIIFKQPGASTQPVDRAVSATLVGLINQLPPGSRWVPIYRQGYLVGLIGSDLGRSLLIGGLLALAVLAWLLGLNRSIAVLAISIPFALLLAIAGLYAFGQTLNLLTLGALSVVVGMLLDDAIIVLEAITLRWQQGLAGTAGVRAGLTDIFIPDVTGTLTTISAYLPLIVVGGLAGLFTRPFALAMSLALLASLLVSLTLIPALLTRYHRPPRPSRTGAAFLDWLKRGNQRLLNLTLKCPRASLLIVTLLFLAALAGAGLLTVNFLPLPNAGVLLDSFTLPPGTGLDETVRTVDAISARIGQDPAVKAVYARIGSARNTSYTERSFEGEIQIVLQPGKTGNHLNTLANHLLKIAQWPDVQQSIDTPTIERVGESLSGLPQPFEISVIGNHLRTLRKLSIAISARLKHLHTLADVFNNDAYPVTQLRIEPRSPALYVADLTPRALFAQLTPLTRGRIISHLPNGDGELDLFIRLANANYLNPAQLGQLPIHTAHGWAPLDRLAKLNLIITPNQIRHIDGARAIEILATPLAPLNQVISQAHRALASLHLPPGYRIQFGGLFLELEKTAQVLGLAIIGALILSFGVMVLQFGELRTPLILLLQAPLALTGGLLALIISGVGLNATGLIGFLTLIGVSLNHGIVLITYARQFEANHPDLESAVRAAVAARLRPIVLTTLTAILGMLPIALGRSAGAAPEQGLAIVVMGGIFFSAVLSTNLLPALYLHSRRQQLAKR